MPTSNNRCNTFHISARGAQDPAWAHSLHENDMARANALKGIASAATAERQVQQALANSVKWAREAGVTWQQVGDILGVTRQAAYQRFGRVKLP